MEKRITIKSIAEVLGVAPSTVSRAFNPESPISDEVRAKILEKAKEFGYVQNRAASRLTMKEIKIGLLLCNIYPAGANEVLRGVSDAYKELCDYKVSYGMEMFGRSEQSTEDCRRLLNHFEDCDALIVSGFTSVASVTEITRFSEAHPNIVLLQSGVSGVPYLFSSVHDCVTSAEMAAEFLGNCLRQSETKRILLFTGDQGLEIHRSAKEAFCRASKTFGLELLGVYDMMDSEEVLSGHIKTLFASGKSPADGIYITSGISLELCRYIDEHKLSDKIALVTFDTYPDLNRYIEKGVIRATVYQDLYRQGRNAFRETVLHIVNKKDVPAVVSPRPELIMKSNLHLYETKTDK